ncbi:MAG TPA: Type 1 glutamine amidotransferase-like domain-containing protein [Gemmatimonadaceae bacterium]|jgi:cyanophycinase-like exopeptidase|nr:Type 1 glutamine amidotransferase-like domain-containing protein [Gemmatimonadaceae bacterium]
MSSFRRALVAAAVVAVGLAPALVAAQTPIVGPPHGTVMVVGGGAMGPDIYAKFIDAAGGPNALIVIVPTAGGDSVYAQNAPTTRGWRQNGAKNLYVYHTTDRTVADAESFVAVLAKAGGVWFDGGRQFHLVDSYAGTKSERGFMSVLERGGVIGGSSAGSAILADFLVRGAPSNNNFILDDPSHEKGFAYLRGAANDMHVIARERLPDLADSIMPKYPKLLGLSEDEGTVWYVKGDTGTILGRNKAFVYGGKDPNDPGKPFLTLYPGDKYNLGSRHVMHRAADDSPVSKKFVDGLLGKYANASLGGATVVVSQNGEVLIDQSYGVPPQEKYMPTTTLPQFSLGGISAVFSGICDQLPEQPAGRGNGGGGAAGGRGRGNAPPMTPFQACVARRISTPIGMHRTTVSADGDVQSDVDELYRLELGLQVKTTFMRDSSSAGGGGLDATRGWHVDSFHGTQRLSAFGKADGKRSAFIRLPERNAAIIVLTNDDNADVKGIADKIADKLLSQNAK